PLLRSSGAITQVTCGLSSLMSGSLTTSSQSSSTRATPLKGLCAGTVCQPAIQATAARQAANRQKADFLGPVKMLHLIALSLLDKKDVTKERVTFRAIARREVTVAYWKTYFDFGLRPNAVRGNAHRPIMPAPAGGPNARGHKLLRLPREFGRDSGHPAAGREVEFQRLLWAPFALSCRSTRHAEIQTQKILRRFPRPGRARAAHDFLLDGRHDGDDRHRRPVENHRRPRRLGIALRRLVEFLPADRHRFLVPVAGHRLRHGADEQSGGGPDRAIAPGHAPTRRGPDGSAATVPRKRLLARNGRRVQFDRGAVASQSPERRPRA